MLCRPGCKCEQQYRMHRLLAFDPSNECRGIFSDWFELPSFCVCKFWKIWLNIFDLILKDHRTVARSNEKLWYFLGKCYESITENFIPRPRKPRVDLEMDAKQSLANAETGKASDTRSNPNGNDTPNKLENISVSKYT